MPRGPIQHCHTTRSTVPRLWLFGVYAGRVMAYRSARMHGRVAHQAVDGAQLFLKVKRKLLEF